MKQIKVGIIKSDFHGHHSGSWSNVWIDYCKTKNIPYTLIDWRKLDSFTEMREHDIVLWHFSHYSHDEMNFARSILMALKSAGCRVYPDHSDAHHFDDKISQSYELNALGISTPKNYPLHSNYAVEEWIKTVNNFPIVAKLKAGSGATNVSMIKNIAELRKYSNQMFSKGLDGKPKTLLKIKSNLISSKSLADILDRLKRAPEFFFTRSQGASRLKEKGYVYLQEFIPNVRYDLKVVVVGDKLSFIGRGVRGNDFRASGSGDLISDRSLIDQSIIDLAFKAADLMQSDCTGFDIITNPQNNMPVILEVSYGFSHSAQLIPGGHFNRLGVWSDQPLNAPYELLDNLVLEVSQ